MIAAIVVLGICAAVQGVPFKRQLIGACVEECSVVGVGFFSGCPHGQTCQSNGCGHTCQPVILGKRESFGACVEMCSPAGSGRLDSCPAGYACMSNGCGHTCQSVMLKGRSIVEPKCPPVLCEMYCSNGFATGADGCPMCSCNSNALPVDLQKLLGTLG
ncbi:WAP four-disulfide core domain protein 3-like isoform X2 [Haliotis cracherodii]|uniref:WAP four-disulfide core domain protein 3-like isoform X2 n=1 Tax=Haliotis cracherodii TaxID=6455 RepID=UPI0039EBFEAA